MTTFTLLNGINKSVYMLGATTVFSTKGLVCEKLNIRLVKGK